MRFIEDLCPPALLYLIFLVVQIGLDASLGMWVTLALKAFFGLAMTVLLDLLCNMDLSIVSWFVVAMPFVVTSLATAIAMGTRFDARVMGGVKENFEQKDHKEEDINVPNASNAIGI